MSKAEFEELRLLIEQVLVHVTAAADLLRPPDEQAALRAEFWSLNVDALVDRRTIAAALYLSKQSLELFATKGGGPKYMRLGRKSYYRKSDVLAWIKKHGQEIEATAQFKPLKEGENDG